MIRDGAAVNGFAAQTVKHLLYPDVLDVKCVSHRLYTLAWTVSGGDLVLKSLMSSPNGGKACSAIILQRD